MTQTWDQLLFAHWPVDQGLLANRIPEQFELDTFDGKAWIAVVPFQMNKVKFRCIPTIPYTDSFLELNVRTYVKYKGRQGVYFFSLDASNSLAVETARIWFGLPYLNAKMSINNSQDILEYKSLRQDQRQKQAELHVRYKPISEVLKFSSDSLVTFLTERYCLFSIRGNKVLEGQIHHLKWELCKAEAEFIHNSMLSPIGLDVDKLGEPILHYSRSLETLEWAPTT